MASVAIPSHGSGVVNRASRRPNVNKNIRHQQPDLMGKKSKCPSTQETLDQKGRRQCSSLLHCHGSHLLPYQKAPHRRKCSQKRICRCIRMDLKRSHESAVSVPRRVPEMGFQLVHVDGDKYSLSTLQC